MNFRHILCLILTTFSFVCAENRYKHEVLVDGEPILFEILDTCPKVRQYWGDIYIPKLIHIYKNGMHEM
jgi:hypothetical protein